LKGKKKFDLEKVQMLMDYKGNNCWQNMWVPKGRRRSEHCFS